jgi:hypothetical protein
MLVHKTKAKTTRGQGLGIQVRLQASELTTKSTKSTKEVVHS